MKNRETQGNTASTDSTSINSVVIRRWILPCSVFGGRSPKTGQLVGSRHRWTNGVCDFCHQHKESVYETVQLIDGKFQRIG